jgi:hypothetical protein
MFILVSVDLIGKGVEQTVAYTRHQPVSIDMLTCQNYTRSLGVQVTTR